MAPHVIVHMMVSVDGRIVNARGRSTKEWAVIWPDLHAEYDRIADSFDADAIMVGSTTMHPFKMPSAEDGPRLAESVISDSELFESFVPRPTISSHHEKQPLYLVVPDSRGRLRHEDIADEGLSPILLCSRATPAGYLRYLRSEELPYIVAGAEKVDLHDALEQLTEKFSIRSIIAEGGGALNGALLRAGMVSEVSLLLLPLAVASTDTPTLFDAPPLRPGDQPKRLELQSIDMRGMGIIWLRYTVT